MRFVKGTHYLHPPRGPGRGHYRMSNAALRSRRNNLSRSRPRSDRETLVIKFWIWQSCFDGGPCPSQRVVARQLRVSPSYVCKVQKQSAEGLEMLASGQRVSLDDLEAARRFTARLKAQEPGQLARATQSSHFVKPRVITAEEAIAKTWREVAEWKLKNLRYSGRRVR